jgi:flagellar motor protein MotB
MKAFIAFFCALLVTDSALAQGVYNMAKQQAKNAAASENKNQQAIDSSGQPAPAPPPPGNSNPQPDPALQATLRNIANLRADFENFAAGQTNRQPLINDLTEAAQGAKASPASVSKLAGHLAAVAGNKKLQAQRQKLAQSVHAIFNSSHLSAVQKQMVCDGVQKNLLEGGTSSDDVANVINDLKTIAAETK